MRPCRRRLTLLPPRMRSVTPAAPAGAAQVDDGEAGEDLPEVHDPHAGAGPVSVIATGALTWLTSTGSASWARSRAGRKPAGRWEASGGSTPWQAGCGPEQLPGSSIRLAGCQSLPGQ